MGHYFVPRQATLDFVTAVVESIPAYFRILSLQEHIMNMSLSEKSLENNADDIWSRHESEIRLLYQTKSLNELKREMDAKPGFPKFA